MHICAEKNFIFFPNPRTGQGTLVNLLNQFVELERLSHEFEVMSYLHSELIAGSKYFTEYKKFGFVRNPYCRLYSAYKFYLTGTSNFYDTRLGNTYVEPLKASFKDFVKNYKTWFGKTCNYMLHDHKRAPHFIPQYEFFFNDGELMLDYVYRYEYYEDEVKSLLEELEISVYQIPRINASYDFPTAVGEREFSETITPVSADSQSFGISPKPELYTDVYDSEMYSIVYELYAKDFEYFGYKPLL